MAKYKTFYIDRLKYLVEAHDDGTFTWKVGAQNRLKGSPAFATKYGTGYLGGMCEGTLLLAHRVRWVFSHGYWPDLWVDHINGDKHDNRIQNLRLAGVALSNHNRRFKNTSGYIGVSKSKVDRQGRYIAQIQKDKKHYHLGYYHDPKEAALVRDKKAIELYGDDAVLNFAPCI